MRLSSASLTLNLAKCDFGKASVTYLGRQVGGGQVRPVDAKVTAILEFPAPATRKALRSFLGLAECQAAFDSVKTLLCSALSLASAVGAGAVLLQEDASGVDHPV